MKKLIVTITVFAMLLFSCSKKEEVILSNENTISKFQLKIKGKLVNGDLDQSTKKITFNVRGVNVSALVPTIEYPGTARISPLSGETQDFSKPVIYTVTAENGNTKNYTVTVNNTPFSTDNTISKFQLTVKGNTIDGNINQSNGKINFQISGADVSALTPTITHDPYATVTPSASQAQDFSKPVVYKVTAENGAVKNYTVTNTLSDKKSITTFSVMVGGKEILGDIDEKTKIISLDAGPVDIKTLVPTIKISKYATISYKNGTAQNFENEVTYTVTAEDGSTKVYKVRVNWPSFHNDGFNNNLYFYIGATTLVRGTFIGPNYGGKLYFSDGKNEYEVTINNSSNYSQGTKIYVHGFTISNNVTTSVYKLYYKRGNTIIQHKSNFDIMADNVPVVTSTNQKSYKYNDTMIITGENLTPSIMIPSNGSLYWIFAPSSTYNYTLSPDKKQITLKLGNRQLFPSYYGNKPEVKKIRLIDNNRREGVHFKVTFN